MSPSYTTRPSGKRYAYYISQALLQNEKERAGALTRVRAEEVERLVLQGLAPAGVKPAPAEDVRKLIERVVVHADRIEILKVLDAADDVEGSRSIIVPARMVRRNRAQILDDGTPSPDQAVVRALARAHEWRGWLENGEARSYRDIASRASVNPGYVQTILPLAFLEPRLTRELLDGRRRINGGLMELLRRGIPLDWQQQRSVF